METKRENNAGAAVHPPEKRANTLLRSCVESMIPEVHLPIEGVALDPKASEEELPVRPVTSSGELLEPVAGNKFVENCGMCKAWIVAAHAHQALVKGHGVGWITDADGVATGEEGVH